MQINVLTVLQTPHNPVVIMGTTWKLKKSCCLLIPNKQAATHIILQLVPVLNSPASQRTFKKINNDYNCAVSSRRICFSHANTDCDVSRNHSYSRPLPISQYHYRTTSSSPVKEQCVPKAGIPSNVLNPSARDGRFETFHLFSTAAALNTMS